VRPLAELLAGTPYGAYLYSYPHKTAYRRLDPPVELGALWEKEDRRSLFLYFHLPFCEMRCGFCNLFTTAKPKLDAVAAYLDALERQARAVRPLLGEARFARFALGGGTPTLLDAAELELVLDLAEWTAGTPLARIPCSVETSPETLDAAKARLLRERGIERVSIGVQSFVDAEVAAVFRPQTRGQVERALGLLASEEFPTLNVDLIYGLPGQDEASLVGSIDSALRFAPEEIYLYPLYVRPLTSLGKSSRAWDDERIALYRAGREALLSRGFRQVSMRMFRRADAPDGGGPVYRCQEDGMLGLGSGARSYTSGLHYSTEYAVGASGVKQIIADYTTRAGAAFESAEWGYVLDGEDRRRRFVVLSLLAEGLDLAAYRARFGSEALHDFPALGELETHALAVPRDGRLVLTEAGLERSDTIGPWLFSERVATLMESWEAR
jgi:oxygen-independent coproporphyrinogen-3 oxidase